MPEPRVIDTNVQTVLDELISDYQSRTGRILQAGQVETLLLNSWAYREGLLRSQIQNAATQNLVEFAIAPILDYLGRWAGVNRLGAVPATVSLGFTLVTGHGAGTIPAGTRVGSIDGKVEFVTLADMGFDSGVTIAWIPSQCSTDGIAGNGYVADTITNLLNPISMVASVTNSVITASGSEAETDDQLRSRIILASSSYSTAGSRQSYIYHAKSAHPSITDVIVTSDTPGTVQIYPKVSGGLVTSNGVLNAVNVACSDETVRPLCDSIEVISPTRLTYTLTIGIVVFSWADQASVLASVQAALTALNVAKSETLGQDVRTEHVIGACMQNGVFSVNIGSFSNVSVAEIEFAFCTSITVTVTGTSNG
jgi:phage-related baseplate assembly protein